MCNGRFKEIPKIGWSNGGRSWGRRRANVVGLAQDSPTGFCIVAGGRSHEEVGDGLETAPAPLKSYWAETDALKQRISNGLVRWWFTLSDAKIPMDPDRRIYKLEKSNVRVLSEAQWINERGSEWLRQHRMLLRTRLRKALHRTLVCCRRTFLNTPASPYLRSGRCFRDCSNRD